MHYIRTFQEHERERWSFRLRPCLQKCFLPSNWAAHNPRCLQRDLNDYVATLYGNPTIIDTLLATTNIVDFQNTTSGMPLSGATIGVHSGGHFSAGLSLQDFFASPSDPTFFLHHGMIDRMWNLWLQWSIWTGVAWIRRGAPLERQFTFINFRKALNL